MYSQIKTIDFWYYNTIGSQTMYSFTSRSTKGKERDQRLTSALLCLHLPLNVRHLLYLNRDLLRTITLVVHNSEVPSSNWAMEQVKTKVQHLGAAILYLRPLCNQPVPTIRGITCYLYFSLRKCLIVLVPSRKYPKGPPHLD